MSSTISMKDSLEVFLEGARVNFRLFGKLIPVFAGMLDGEPQIMSVVWENGADKQKFADQVQNWIRCERLTEFIMVVEAWAAPASSLTYFKQHGTLETAPDRTEIVIVTYTSPSEEIQCTAEIIRGTIGAELGPWQRSDRKTQFNLDDFSTKFQGLFLKGKAEQN